MDFTVKNTTFRSILDIIYPCYCKGCGKNGEAFCWRCYNYNKALNPAFSRVLLPDFHKLYVVGLREGVLAELVSEYKFFARKQYLPVLAKMVFETISSDGSLLLPPNTQIVPLPTVSKHIRERGFDHTLELAREISRISGFKVANLLVRDKSSVQVGKSSKVRLEQARRAYRLNLEAISEISRETPILLFDDVWTTGASMKNASRILRSAGFTKVYGVVLAKNDGYEFS